MVTGYIQLLYVLLQLFHISYSNNDCEFYLRVPDKKWDHSVIILSSDSAYFFSATDDLSIGSASAKILANTESQLVVEYAKNYIYLKGVDTLCWKRKEKSLTSDHSGNLYTYKKTSLEKILDILHDISDEQIIRICR